MVSDALNRGGSAFMNGQSDRVSAAFGCFEGRGSPEMLELGLKDMTIHGDLR
jgi:hypothetical protein